MGVLIRVTNPSVVRAGGVPVSGMGDLLNQMFTSVGFTVNVELRPTYPGTMIVTSGSNTIRVFVLPPGASSESEISVTPMGGMENSQTINFTLGNRSFEQAGGLHRLRITGTDNQSSPQTSELQVYYYRTP